MTNIISKEDSQKSKININVLVAPLDWGLGHASRCIPLIRILLQKGCHIFIATDGPQEKLLKLEFPDLEYIKLPGYRVSYSKKWLLGYLAGQLLKIKNAISSEHEMLKHLIKAHDINWVISDNRYGLHNQVPSVIITHQLHIELPALLKWAEKYVQQKLYGYIGKYDACWVPDLIDNERGLSGALGHPEIKPPIAPRYIGWMSRFETDKMPEITHYKCLIILSGPEPQRSILENMLVKQLQQSKHQVILIRGLPNENSSLDLPKNITVFNHLSSKDMLKAYVNSEYLISRSGYSTLMDAYILQKKSIFIPTPGQTEQEYLGKRLAGKNMALVYKQVEFNLETALIAASKFTFHFPLNTMNNLLEMAVDNFLLTHFNETDKS